MLRFLVLSNVCTIPNSANPSINVLRARGLITSSLWGSNTCLARVVWLESKFAAYPEDS